MQRIEHNHAYAAAHQHAQELVPASQVRTLRRQMGFLVALLMAALLFALWATARALMTMPAQPAAAAATATQQPVIIQIESGGQRAEPSQPRQPRNTYNTKMIADAERMGISSLWQTERGTWRGMCQGRRQPRICEWNTADRVWEVEILGANPIYEIWSNR